MMVILILTRDACNHDDDDDDDDVDDDDDDNDGGGDDDDDDNDGGGDDDDDDDDGEPLMQLVAVDWFKADVRIDHLARRKGNVVQVARGMKGFVLVINLQVPAAQHYSMVFYYVPIEPIKHGTLLHRFIEGDASFRNNRLKLIPSVAKGSWLVRQSVGTTPCIVGKALECTYHRGENYLEIDVDIGSSVVANGVLSLVFSFITSLVVDMGFVIQGNTEEELPEQLFGTVRVSKVELSSAVAPPPADDAGPTENGYSAVETLSQGSCDQQGKLCDFEHASVVVRWCCRLQQILSLLPCSGFPAVLSPSLVFAVAYPSVRRITEFIHRWKCMHLTAIMCCKNEYGIIDWVGMFHWQSDEESPARGISKSLYFGYTSTIGETRQRRRLSSAKGGFGSLRGMSRIHDSTIYTTQRFARLNDLHAFGRFLD
ncbi:hypothetical protein CBR_g28664 [Chara braunii]|uniref:Protein ENHANCED DISEASE RESISTANCE 2 C-terminal domain-containing protein n=1 Tax=Chara braunii TaxID=69332 RepID=A0A388L9G0_CHABU|nr:hypothetical protein CBR_g28664 [Chara braunii]|eukprot:GBG78949.1 hypothetical protein CBR_g28664 [Chara braunii]